MPPDQQRRTNGDFHPSAPSDQPNLPAEPWLTPGRLLRLVAVLLAAWAAVNVIAALRTILVMLLVALFLSFAMEPAVQWLSRHGMRRGLATGLVFLGVLLATAGIVRAIVPLLVSQATDLVRNVPQYLERLDQTYPNVPFVGDLGEDPELRTQVATFGEDLGARLNEVVLGAAGNVVTLGRTALGVLFQLLSIALVTFYLVADGPRARRVLARPLPPGRQREMLAIWELAVGKTGGYIYSRVLLAAICAAVTSLVLVVLGVPYPVPLGLFVGVTSAFVPVVGTYLGGVLLLLVAFVDDPLNALWAAVFLVIYQQVENYLLAPRVQARTMNVHPAVAFVAVLVGGTLLGAVGALLALPAAAIIQALLSTYVRRHELIAELGEVSLPEDDPRLRELALQVRNRRRELRRDDEEPPIATTRSAAVTRSGAVTRSEATRNRPRRRGAKRRGTALDDEEPPSTTRSEATRNRP